MPAPEGLGSYRVITPGGKPNPESLVSRTAASGCRSCVRGWYSDTRSAGRSDARIGTITDSPAATETGVGTRNTTWVAASVDSAASNWARLDVSADVASATP